MLPLEGTRVLDLTNVLAGPFCGYQLARMGAEVVKVENPKGGDLARRLGADPEMARREMGLSFVAVNAHKQSIALDLKDPRGKAVFLELVEHADVVLENFRPNVMKRLGLDYASLAASNERLVYCACYGYGEGGPYAGRPGVDDTIQAACGLAWLQGVGADAPRYVNTVVADKIMGMWVTQSIAMALYARERTGRGQAIEVPMFEGMVAFTLPEHLGGLTFDPPLGPPGYARLLNAFRKPFKTLDGYVGVVPYIDAHWRKFFAIIGAPQLAEDERFRRLVDRSRHFAELYRIVATALATRTTGEWIALLADADIPFAKMNTIEDLLTDEHLVAIGFWHHVDHPTEGRLNMPGIPVSFSETPGAIRRHAPALGEHTAEVLREIGMNEEGAS